MFHNGLMWKLNGQPKSQTNKKKESGLHSICEILCVCLCVALQNRWEGIKCHSLPLTNLILQHFISDLMALHAITRPRVWARSAVCCAWVRGGWAGRYWHTWVKELVLSDRWMSTLGDLWSGVMFAQSNQTFFPSADVCLATGVTKNNGRCNFVFQQAGIVWQWTRNATETKVNLVASSSYTCLCLPLVLWRVKESGKKKAYKFSTLFNTKNDGPPWSPD